VFDAGLISRLRQLYHCPDTVLRRAAEECMGDIVAFTTTQWSAFQPLDPPPADVRLSENELPDESAERGPRR
jgi:hypothetical protein